MSGKYAKHKAKAFIKEYGVREIDYASLCKIVQSQGYTVVEFNHIFNDEDVDTLIQALKLGDNISGTRGFTYADKNYRIVFIHEDLSDAEKLLVLAHEEGHIYCGHMTSGAIIGKDVRDEFEANEFSHFLLDHNNVSSWLYKNKRKLITIAVILILTICAFFSAVVIRRNMFYEEYYITESGNKYHEKDCVYVKDKKNVRRLTIGEYESGEYKPCGKCLP